MATFQNRIIDSAKLRSAIYEEVEADKGATGQAITVVLLSSIAAGIGIGAVAKAGFSGIITGLVVALAGWLIWAFLTYVIGAKLFPESGTKTNMGELLRTIGFSSSPGLIRIFGVIPGLTSLIFFISSIWMFAAMVVGVKQALDYTSTSRAVGVCLLGWLVQVALSAAVFYMSGRPVL